MYINFEEIKKMVLPYFISVHGEEYSDVVSERMNKIVPLFYTMPSMMEYNIKSRQDAKKAEIALEFLKSSNYEMYQEFSTTLVNENFSSFFSPFSIYDSAPVAFLKSCFGKDGYNIENTARIRNISQQPVDDLAEKNSNLLIVNALGANINIDEYNNWVFTEDATCIFKKIEELRKILLKLDDEYLNFDKQFDNTRLTICNDKERKKTIEKELNEKLYLEFLISIKSYMSPKDIMKLEELINTNSKDYNSLDIVSLVGNSFFSNGFLDCFGIESDEKLSKNSNDYMDQVAKKVIINKRIAYYKSIGKYDGNMSPEEFIMSNIAVNNAPSQMFINDINEKKKSYQKLVKKEIARSISNFDELLSIINNINLIEKFDIDGLLDSITNGGLCIMPSITTNGETRESIAFLLFPMGANGSTIDMALDVSIIHEMNHAIELCLASEELGCDHKCGFELISENRNYENFSETVNHMIAIEITDTMHKDGVYLLDYPLTCDNVANTMPFYMSRKPIIEKFWHNFKNDILRSRKEKNLESLFNIVGKENFDKLNELVNQFNELSYRERMRSEKKNLLVEQAEAIVDSMIDYSQKYTIEDTIEEFRR